jgi:basic amino acid/polyamine antiporter, APA family
MADLNPSSKRNEPVVFTKTVHLRSRFSAATSMPAADESDSQSNRRVLTLIPASSIVVASMLGTGIFTTTGLMIHMGAGGGDVLLAWLLGGVVALCGALCYGEIGANLPRSGGEYFYLSRLLHPSLGVMSGWVSLVVGFAAPIAASAMAMHFYLARIVPNWPVRSMAVLTIILLSVLHAFDVRLGGRVQSTLIAIQVILLLAFIVGALFRSNHVASFMQFNPSFWSSSAFAVVLIFVSFAYSGWNAAAYVGGEISDPQKTLPRSLLLGAGAVGVLYVLVNVSYLSAVPTAQLSGVKEVAHDVAQRLWGTTGGNLTTALIALTLISPVSAMIMIGPRVLEAMSLDGFMPRSFSKLNRRSVPSTAVFVQAALAALIAVTSSFGPLLIYIGFTLTIFAALTVLSLFRLRQRPDIKRVCVGYPVTPVIFLAFALWATVWSIRAQPIPALAVLATLLVGYIAYAIREMKIRMESTLRDNMGVYTNKIVESAQEIIRQAYDEAKSLNDPQLRPQHVLIAIAKLRQPQFDALLRGLRLERETVLQALAGEPNQSSHTASGLKISREFDELLSFSHKHARENKRRMIESEDILFGLFVDRRSSIAKTFSRLGADHEELLRQLQILHIN